MTTNIRPLLVELLTEELPPKALQKLGQSFAEGVRATLARHGLLADGCAVQAYATPRRLAVRLSAVREQAPDQAYAEKLMPVKIGLAEDGTPTPALQKKLAAKGLSGLDPATLARESDGKQEYLVARGTAPGARLADALQDGIAAAIDGLPIPKVMRYQLADGVTTVKFVRPAHGLVALHGAEVLPVAALGLSAGRETLGHRFMSRGPIAIADADAYAATLAEKGRVVASFEARRAEIQRQLQEHAARLSASLGDGPEVAALLDEVTALVEHPTVYVGEFEEQFLQVPQECLILTMRLNQKYFPLFDPATGRLTHRFLIVSNMQTDNPVNIIEGNQRVVRPRLADARFFFEQDRKLGFSSRLPRLDKVVYHNRLGSVGDRVGRIVAVSRFIAGELGSDVAQAETAARLAKADLITEMVGEFPELQGTMGRYYALDEGLGDTVAFAIEQHYWPRFAGDRLPQGNVACAVALADKLESLVGFFGIGELPTGDRDPFGLRRAALGVLRILMETPLPLDLGVLLDQAAASFAPGMIDAGFKDKLLEFMHERLRNLLREAGHAADAIDAVIALRPTRIDQVLPRLLAVDAFRRLPEAEALAAANKRIVNILKKVDQALPEADIALLQEDAEKALFQRVIEIAPLVRSHVRNDDYTEALRVLAGLRDEVDQFFDNVMVMSEEPLIRANRLGLLSTLADLMNQVADISRLSAS